MAAADASFAADAEKAEVVVEVALAVKSNHKYGRLV